VAGKIVVYNQGWLGHYISSVPYRMAGASEASKKGAIAALISTVTDLSINSPHTGQQACFCTPSHELVTYFIIVRNLKENRRRRRRKRKKRRRSSSSSSSSSCSSGCSGSSKGKR